MLPAFHALREHDLGSLTELAEATAAGQIRYAVPTGKDATQAAKARENRRRQRDCARSTGTGASGTSWSRSSAIRRSGRGST